MFLSCSPSNNISRLTFLLHSLFSIYLAISFHISSIYIPLKPFIAIHSSYRCRIITFLSWRWLLSTSCPATSIFPTPSFFDPYFSYPPHSYSFFLILSFEPWYSWLILQSLLLSLFLYLLSYSMPSVLFSFCLWVLSDAVELI